MTGALCHPDRVHLAKGLCKPCYAKAWAKTEKGRVGNLRRNARWRVTNADRKRAQARTWHAKDYAANPDKYRKRARAYYEQDPAKVIATANATRHKRRAAGSSGVRVAAWREILETFGNVCAYCLKPGQLTRDHVEPIARGGLDEYDNVVPACKSCNSRKSAGTLLRFARIGAP